MEYEYTGKTEKEAIEKAIKELGLRDSEFDVEIMDIQKGKSIFNRGSVTVKIHPHNLIVEEEETFDNIGDSEKQLVLFIDNLLEKCGFIGKAKINRIKKEKIYIDIDSEDSKILIGRNGRNLDAIQQLANSYVRRFAGKKKAIIDVEQYRAHYEQKIVEQARKNAEIVQRSGRSRLLSPMNPFERRLIHSELNGVDGIATVSEGEGVYKQIRIIQVENDN